MSLKTKVISKLFEAPIWMCLIFSLLALYFSQFSFTLAHVFRLRITKEHFRGFNTRYPVWYKVWGEVTNQTPPKLGRNRLRPNRQIK